MNRRKISKCKEIRIDRDILLTPSFRLELMKEWEQKEPEMHYVLFNIYLNRGKEIDNILSPSPTFLLRISFQ